jgi:hypothetical protein
LLTWTFLPSKSSLCIGEEEAEKLGDAELWGGNELILSIGLRLREGERERGYEDVLEVKLLLPNLSKWELVAAEGETFGEW